MYPLGGSHRDVAGIGQELWIELDVGRRMARKVEIYKFQAQLCFISNPNL